MFKERKDVSILFFSQSAIQVKDNSNTVESKYKVESTPELMKDDRETDEKKEECQHTAISPVVLMKRDSN